MGRLSIFLHFFLLSSVLSQAQPRFAVVPGEVPPIDESMLAYRFDEDDQRHVVTFELELDGGGPVQVQFADFRLPEGASVVLSSRAEDGSVVTVGPYQGAGPVQSGEFWSDALAAGRITVELRTIEAFGTLPFTVAGVSRAEGEVADRALGAPHADPEFLFEGDILTGGAEKRVRAGVSVDSAAYRWPGGVVPYEISPGLPNTQRIATAVAHWNARLEGVLRLVPRASEGVYLQFVRPYSAGVCASYVRRSRYRSGTSVQPAM